MGWLMRIENKKLCESYRKMPCLVCGGYNSVSGHHLRTRGSGGPDIEENLIPLCFSHHAEIHNVGLVKFCQSYSAVKWYILGHDWYYCSLQERYYNDKVYNIQPNEEW